MATKTPNTPAQKLLMQLTNLGHSAVENSNRLVDFIRSDMTTLAQSSELTADEIRKWVLFDWNYLEGNLVKHMQAVADPTALQRLKLLYELNNFHKQRPLRHAVRGPKGIKQEARKPKLYPCTTCGGHVCTRDFKNKKQTQH